MWDCVSACARINSLEAMWDLLKCTLYTHRQTVVLQIYTGRGTLHLKRLIKLFRNKI